MRFVEADVRGSALGSRLLAEAERQAIELGAKNAKLDTFEWQAPAFYRKHGYEEYARVDDYAPDFYLVSIKNRWRAEQGYKLASAAGHGQSRPPKHA